MRKGSFNFNFLRFLLLVSFSANLLNHVASKPLTKETKIEGERVKVGVYYEAVNHDSRTFILEELAPVWNKYREFIDLEIVPYGRTVKNEEGADSNFTCPGGSQQCLSMALHACVVEAFWEAEEGDNEAVDGPAQTVEFIRCTFKNRDDVDPVTSAERCVNQIFVGDEWRLIEQCAVVNGDIMLGIMADKTEALGALTEVPVITIDGTQSPGAVTDLKKAVCDAYQGSDKPDSCSIPKAEKVKLDIYYNTHSKSVGNFMLRQLSKYFYHHFEEIVDIELIPYGLTQKGEDGNFICPNDNHEVPCFGNKVHAVILDHFANESNSLSDFDPIDGKIRAIDFITCTFQSEHWTDMDIGGPACLAEELPVPSGPLDWANLAVQVGFKGNELLEANRIKTEAIAPEDGFTYVPHVVVNGQHSVDGEHNLLHAICEAYEGDDPEICSKLHLIVFFDMLNQPSRNFYLNEFYYLWWNFPDIYEVDLEPAGLTTFTGTIEDNTLEFTCPGGPDQCDANKIAACAIDLLWHLPLNNSNNGMNGEDQAVEFIRCFYKNKHHANVYTDAETCANEIVGFDFYRPLESCARGPDGDHLLITAIEKKRELLESPQNTPVLVLINNTYVEDAPNNLIYHVCDYYQSADQPTECIEPKAERVKIGIYYESMDEASRDFWVNQLTPSVYSDIEELMEIELIPYGTATTDDSTDPPTITCSLDNQCFTNLIHLAAIDLLWTREDEDVVDGKMRVVDFINCQFKDENWQDVGESGVTCSNSELPNDEWTALVTHAEEPDTVRLYAQMGEKTKALTDPAFSTAPYITVSGQYSEEAQQDFLLTVCHAYEGTHPLACERVMPTTTPGPETTTPGSVTTTTSITPTISPTTTTTSSSGSTTTTPSSVTTSITTTTSIISTTTSIPTTTTTTIPTTTTTSSQDTTTPCDCDGDGANANMITLFNFALLFGFLHFCLNGLL